MTYETCNCEGFLYMVDRGSFKVSEIVNVKTFEHICYAPKMKLGGRWYGFRWCPFCGKDLEDKEARKDDDLQHHHDDSMRRMRGGTHRDPIGLEQDGFHKILS